jgi:phosphoribosyl-ATP pyrophosphohydrolase
LLNLTSWAKYYEFEIWILCEKIIEELIFTTKTLEIKENINLIDGVADLLFDILIFGCNQLDIMHGNGLI